MTPDFQPALLLPGIPSLDSKPGTDHAFRKYGPSVCIAGLQAHPDKRGKLSTTERMPPESLRNVAKHPSEWIRRVQGTESNYYRATGSAESLMLKAAELGQRWMKGVSGELALQKLREQTLPW